MSKPWIRVALGAAAAGGVLWAAKAIKDEMHKSHQRELEKRLDDARDELEEKLGDFQQRLATLGMQKHEALVEVLQPFWAVYEKLPTPAVVSDDLNTPEPLFFSAAALDQLRRKTALLQALGEALRSDDEQGWQLPMEFVMRQKIWSAVGVFDVRPFMAGADSLESFVQALMAAHENLNLCLPEKAWLSYADEDDDEDNERPFEEDVDFHCMECSHRSLCVSTFDLLLIWPEKFLPVWLDHCRAATQALERVVQEQGAEAAASSPEARAAITAARYLIGWSFYPIMDQEGEPADTDDRDWLLEWPDDPEEQTA